MTKRPLFAYQIKFTFFFPPIRIYIFTQRATSCSNRLLWFGFQFHSWSTQSEWIKKNGEIIIIFSLLGALGTIIININRIIKLNKLFIANSMQQWLRLQIRAINEWVSWVLSMLCELCNFNQYIQSFHVGVLCSSHSERMDVLMRAATSPIVCLLNDICQIGWHQTNEWVENEWERARAREWHAVHTNTSVF